MEMNLICNRPLLFYFHRLFDISKKWEYIPNHGDVALQTDYQLGGKT